MDTDRIDKRIVLRAPRERVWKAVSEAKAFGSWFGVEFDGAFREGARLTGRIVPTTVDPEVARMQERHRGMPFAFSVGRIEPPRRIEFRWHPFAIEPGIDYSHEEATLIVFELTEVDGGTQLTITESGFDRIPIERRAKAFAANDAGWSHQLKLVEKYLALQAA